MHTNVIRLLPCLPAMVFPAVCAAPALESNQVYMFKQHCNTILFKQQGNSQPLMAGQLNRLQEHATTALYARKMKMTCHTIHGATLVDPYSQSSMLSRLHEVCHLTMHIALCIFKQGSFRSCFHDDDDCQLLSSSPWDSKSNMIVETKCECNLPLEHPQVHVKMLVFCCGFFDCVQWCHLSCDRTVVWSRTSVLQGACYNCRDSYTASNNGVQVTVCRSPNHDFEATCRPRTPKLWMGHEFPAPC